MHVDSSKHNIQKNFIDSNTDGSFTVADSNLFFESLGDSSNSSRKQIFRGILGKFSYFIMKLYVVCTH